MRFRVILTYTLPMSQETDACLSKMTCVSLGCLSAVAFCPIKGLVKIVNELLQVQLLGGLSARRGDRIVHRFGTHKAGALLAYLAFYPNRRHVREALAEILWPETARQAAPQPAPGTLLAPPPA